MKKLLIKISRQLKNPFYGLLSKMFRVLRNLIYVPISKWILDRLLQYHYDQYRRCMEIDIMEVFNKPGHYPKRVIYHRFKFNELLAIRKQLGPTRWKPLAGA